MPSPLHLWQRPQPPVRTGQRVAAPERRQPTRTFLRFADWDFPWLRSPCRSRISSLTEASAMLIRNRQEWELRESEATPEAVYLRRREILAGVIAAGLLPTAAPAAANPPATLKTTQPFTPPRPTPTASPPHPPLPNLSPSAHHTPTPPTTT